MVTDQFFEKQGIKLHYYEIKNGLQPLVLIHAQGVDGASYANVWGKLSKKYHVYSVDCYGHGKSLHDPQQYNVQAIGDAIVCFLEEVVQQKTYLLGHSSGGLLAAYAASHTELCSCLILEDPPFFASQGEGRKRTYNYVDLSTVCHQFISREKREDFVLYYFENQYAWNFFPEKSREKTRQKMTALAAKDRQRHPERDLKVPFWPKSALAGFQGMGAYDPLFGESFYTDCFHAGIPHEELLKGLKCRTVFLKAKTNVGADGLLMAALSEEDLQKIAELVPQLEILRFDCGHGIHMEKPREFVKCLAKLAP